MSLEDAPPPDLLAADVQSSPPVLDPEQVAAQSGWVRAVARNLVRDPWGAEDVAQEALLAALAAPPRQVPDDTHLRAWLGRVAFNLSRLDLRSGGRRRARERVVARREALPSPLEELEAAAARGELARALRALDAPGREVLQLRYFDGLGTSEIAVRLGISELAVRKRLWRAREKLRASLEPRRRNLQGWLALGALRRWLRLEVAGVAAAGATAFLALEHGASRRAVELEAAPVVVAERAAHADSAASEELGGSPGQGRGVRGQGRGTRLPLAPEVLPEPPEREPSDTRIAPRTARVGGLVLDLEGAPRPGLEVLARETPERVLAVTDALGGFEFTAQRAGELEARGAGLVTVVPGRTLPGAEEALVLVAPAASLQATILAADGSPLSAAEVELLARETAFARVARPVNLPSPVLQRHAPVLDGTLHVPALARAEGLILRISCPGFEPLEQATLALGASAVFHLEPEAAGPELAGLVTLADGRPAAGARVRLAMAETSTDARGNFRLPLRGAGPGAALEVRARGFAREVESEVVRRFERGELRDGVAVVLDRPLDPVRGHVRGSEPSFLGWRVLAFVAGEEDGPFEAQCDAVGAFEFELPRGAVELHALAPDRLESQAARLDDTRRGEVELVLAPVRLVEERVLLRADDGRQLAGAEVELALALGAQHPVVWGRVTSDPTGEVRYRRAVQAEVGLAVSHAWLGPRAQTVPAAPSLVLARARSVRLSGMTPSARTFRVLDAQGVTLSAEGPLGSAEAFTLAEGHGAVTFVPPGARWIELLGEGAPCRLELDSEPGASLTLGP